MWFSFLVLLHFQCGFRVGVMCGLSLVLLLFCFGFWLALVLVLVWVLALVSVWFCLAFGFRWF